jgi:putative ABC transport system permease protein
MDLTENIRESFRAVRTNLLRAILTALIIAFGIMSLVGILTAIDGIKNSVSKNFSAFGGNSFVINSKTNRATSQQGKKSKIFPPIEYKELVQFKENFQHSSRMSISASLSQSAEVKRLSRKTNPNIRIRGVDENFLVIRGLDLSSGRNFSMIELSHGTNVAIIGDQVYEALFSKNENTGDHFISFWGDKFKVVGVLKKEGGMGGSSGADRSVFIPVSTASRMARYSRLSYNLDVEVINPVYIDQTIGEATGLMRIVRQDPLMQEDSFEIKKNESVIEMLEKISGYLRMGGFVIGFITLLGASIGLMNIMLVSVKERTREIGIRKTVGATPQRIRQQFLMEAIIICQLGGITGIILGILLGNGVVVVLNASGFVVPWIWMLVGVSVCFFVGLISGYYPAYKASKVDPIESLRFE